MPNVDLKIRVLWEKADDFLGPMQKGITAAKNLRTETNKAVQESMASIRKMQSQMNATHTLDGLRKQAVAATADLEKLRRKQAELLKISQGSPAANPAKYAEAIRELPKLTAEINAAEMAEQKLLVKTDAMSAAMKNAGIDADNLADEQKRLAKAIEVAENALDAQGGELQQAQVRMERYEGALKDLQRQENQLAKLNLLQRKYDEQQAKVTLATQRHQELEQRQVSGAKATERHAQVIERAALKLQKFKDAAAGQKQELEALQAELEATGLDTRNLANAQAELERRMQSANADVSQQSKALLRLAEAEKAAARAERERKQTRFLAQRKMQERLQTYQDVAGVAYPALAGGSAILYGAAQPVMQAASHQDAVRQIAITGDMTNATDEKQLSMELRRAARDANQKQDVLDAGVNTLVASGMEAKTAGSYADLLGDTATATRAEMTDVANVTYTLQNNMKIEGRAEMEAAMNNLVYASKQGSFEFKDMARYFPSIAANMQSMGGTGQDAVKEIGVAMQAARKATGTAGDAAANIANWFSHMTAGSTQEHFASAGIDLQAEMMKRIQAKDPAERMSAFRASIDVFDSYIDKLTEGKSVTIRNKKGKVEKVINFRQALEDATKTGNEAEVKSIVERFGLSEIIQDMQTANFYLAMRQNKGFIDKTMTAFDGAEVKNTIATDKARQMELATEQYKAMTIAAEDAGRSVGENILPALQKAMERITPLLDKFNQWVQANPELTQTLLQVVAVVGAVLAGFGGLALVIIGLLGPLAMLKYAMTLMRTSVILTTAATWGARAAMIALRGIGLVGMLLSMATSFTVAGIAAGAASAGAWLLAGAMAVLTSPITLVIAAVALLAAGVYYLYTRWDDLVKWWNGSELKQQVMPIYTGAMDYAREKWDQLKLWWESSTLTEKVLGIVTAPIQIAKTIAGDLFNYWLTTELGQKFLKVAIPALLYAREKAKEFVDWWNNISLKNITASISTRVSESWVGKGYNAAKKWLGGDKADGARAAGGPVSAGGIYRVNELGPELLSMGGMTYLMASQPGYVTPLMNQLPQVLNNWRSVAANDSLFQEIINQELGQADSKVVPFVRPAPQQQVISPQQSIQITINAAPGMSERDLTEEVQRVLRDEFRRSEAKYRGRPYD